MSEICDALPLLVGMQAPAGSPLIRSNAAYDVARLYLFGKVGLLIDEDEDNHGKDASSV